MSFDIESEAKLLQNSKREWIEREHTLGGDPKVIEFISGVLFHGALRVTTNDSVETIRSLFEAGYCYYFAKMLEDAFPGGIACLCYPFGHVVYVYEGVAYDIGGVTDAEYESFIPLTWMRDGVNDFRHVPGIKCSLTADKLEDLAQKYKRSGQKILAITAYSKEVVEASRAVATKSSDVKYAGARTTYSLESQRLQKDLANGFITDEQYCQFMTQACAGVGLSYPLIQRFSQEDRTSKCEFFD